MRKPAKNYTKHIEWTADKIARFWNAYEDRPGMQDWHFSKMRGASLLRFAAARVDLAEPILDLGCGSGHLLAHLLKRKRSVGADLSSRSVEIVQNRFAGNANFLGMRLVEKSDTIPFDNSSVSTVFLLETLEHLLDCDVLKVLADIHRILTPGGGLILTTPHKENLELAMADCAACGARFHRVQHVRSLDPPLVRNLLVQAGFSVSVCRAALLLPDPGVWLAAQRAPGRAKMSCPECGARIGDAKKGLWKRLRGLANELGHLVCIAHKR